MPAPADAIGPADATLSGAEESLLVDGAATQPASSRTQNAWRPAVAGFVLVALLCGACVGASVQSGRLAQRHSGVSFSQEEHVRKVYDSHARGLRQPTTAPPLKEITDKNKNAIPVFASRNGFTGDSDLGGGKDQPDDIPDPPSPGAGRGRSGVQVSDAGGEDPELEGTKPPAPTFPGPDDSAPDSTCARYGCGTFSEDNPCQCNDDCGDFHTCCDDYEDVCTLPPTPAPTPEPPRESRHGSGGGDRDGSCKGRCFEPFQRDAGCQCNDDCAKFQSCCNDFKDQCGGDSDGGSSDSAGGRSGGSKGAHGGGHSHKGSSAGGSGRDSDKDCDKDFESRLFKWSDTKKEWCCRHENVGCEEGAGGGPAGRRDSAHHGGRGGGASCEKFGCSDGYVKSQECQCNSDCEKYDSCCDDYQDSCSGSSAAGWASKSSSRGGSCATYGCVDFTIDHDCQCNDGCEEYETCCHDFKKICTAAAEKGGVDSMSHGSSSSSSRDGGRDKRGGADDGVTENDYFSGGDSSTDDGEYYYDDTYVVGDEEQNQVTSEDSDPVEEQEGTEEEEGEAPSVLGDVEPTPPTSVPTPPPTPPAPTPDPDEDLALR